MASKYASILSKMTGSYAGLDSLAEKSEKSSKAAADSSYVASALPYALSDAFRKNADPELDKAITAKTQQVLGGAIEGLDKYQDISNPFTRRALAEKYQGGLSIGLESLTSEKERRQGKFEDYITKWSGLFGAEAARKQTIAQQDQNAFSTAMSLADKLEDQRRYNISQAKSGLSTSDSEAFRSSIITNLRKSVGNDGKVDPTTYAELRDYAYEVKGMSKSEFDNQFSDSLGEHEYERLGIKTTAVKEKTPKQEYEDSKYQQLNAIPQSRGDVSEGEVYRIGNKYYRKKTGWTGGNNDEEVEI